MATDRDKQQILGLIRHLERMSTEDKRLYQDIMTRHPRVAELIQNEARLSPEAVELFEKVQQMMKTGDARGVAEALRT